MAQQFSLADLRHFSGGTDNYYRHELTRMLYTDGVRYVADKAGAHWLIDKIATHQMVDRFRREEFQVWKLMVTGSKALLTCDDGNDNVFHSEEITYTDFPAPGVKVFFSNGVIYLPEEH